MNFRLSISPSNLQISGIVLWLTGMLFAASMSLAQDQRTRYFPNIKEIPASIPTKENVWVFIMAGQSNMAGRGIVEAMDTISNRRILTVNAENELILAKEPLHFYEPNITGLDCGMSFAIRLLENVGKDVTIILIPAAVGGSSSHQWLGDSLHRGVKLMTNFQQRVAIGLKYGTVKGILWHQGESDTNDRSIPGYQERLGQIFQKFRNHCGDPTLPVLIGKLGSYSENQSRWDAINKAIESYALTDKRAFVINTSDLKSKDDKIHFDSEGQRTMGRRMAEKLLDAAFQKK